MKKELSTFILCTLLPLNMSGCKQNVAATESARSSYSPYGGGEATPLRWNDTHLENGVTLKIASEVADLLDYEDGENGYTDAGTQWNNALPEKTLYALPFSIVTNRQKALVAYLDDEMGIYKSDNWYPEVGAGALAITQFFGIRRSSASGQYIELQHADIILNFRDYSFTSNPNDYTSYDLPSVVLHEMGHFVGLRHEYSTYDSVMRPSLGSYESERQLYPIDIHNLKVNYSISEVQQLSTKSISNAAIRDNGPSSNSGELVQGRFEMRANGHCVHFINEQEVGTHAYNGVDLFNRIYHGLESI